MSFMLLGIQNLLLCQKNNQKEGQLLLEAQTQRVTFISPYLGETKLSYAGLISFSKCKHSTKVSRGARWE